MKPSENGFGIEPSSQDGKVFSKPPFLPFSLIPKGSLTTLDNNTPTAHPCPNITPVTYTAFYAQFARALDGTGDVPVRPEDASAVIRIIELARRSSQEGRTLDVGT